MRGHLNGQAPRPLGPSPKAPPFGIAPYSPAGRLPVKTTKPFPSGVGRPSVTRRDERRFDHRMQRSERKCPQTRSRLPSTLSRILRYYLPEIAEIFRVKPMPRNRVQHQKGLSDDAFEQLYPD